MPTAHRSENRRSATAADRSQGQDGERDSAHGYHLRRLLRSESGAVFLVLDGHPVRRSRKVARWVAEWTDRIRLFFLPPYCPDLNPTEYLNNSVKGAVPRFWSLRDRGELADPVRLCLRVVQRRAQFARRFFDAEPVRYAA